MEKIIIITRDNKLLLSKDWTSEKIVIDKSIKIEYSKDELIIKLLNDYKQVWDIDVTDNWDIYI